MSALRITETQKSLSIAEPRLFHCAKRLHGLDNRSNNATQKEIPVNPRIPSYLSLWPFTGYSPNPTKAVTGGMEFPLLPRD